MLYFSHTLFSLLLQWCVTSSYRIFCYALVYKSFCLFIMSQTRYFDKVFVSPFFCYETPSHSIIFNLFILPVRIRKFYIAFNSLFGIIPCLYFHICDGFTLSSRMFHIFIFFGIKGARSLIRSDFGHNERNKIFFFRLNVV